MRLFRFGVNVRTAGSHAEWADKVRKVEALGYAVVLVPDHLADLLAPMPGLTAAAAATTRLRVGTGAVAGARLHGGYGALGARPFGRQEPRAGPGLPSRPASVGFGRETGGIRPGLVPRAHSCRWSRRPVPREGVTCSPEGPTSLA